MTEVRSFCISTADSYTLACPPVHCHTNCLDFRCCVSCVHLISLTVEEAYAFVSCNTSRHVFIVWDDVHVGEYKTVTGLVLWLNWFWGGYGVSRHLCGCSQRFVVPLRRLLGGFVLALIRPHSFLWNGVIAYFGTKKICGYATKIPCIVQNFIQAWNLSQL